MFKFWTTSMYTWFKSPDSKVYGANMGPIWGRQDPGGPHVGPMNFAIWEVTSFPLSIKLYPKTSQTKARLKCKPMYTAL